MRSEAQKAALQKLIAKNKALTLFDNVDDFVGLFEQYVDSVRHTEEVPTYSNFAAWIGDCSKYSIFKFMHDNPVARDRTAEIMADALVEGAIQGRFRDAPTIFALKNRCNWTDKKESINHHETADLASYEETQNNLKKIMHSMGFDDRQRPTREAKANMADMEERIIRLAEAKTSAGGTYGNLDRQAE